MDSFNSFQNEKQRRSKEEGRRLKGGAAAAVAAKKMASSMKQVRKAGQSQRFRFIVLVVGCFLVAMTFLVVSRPSYSGAENPDVPNEVKRFGYEEKKESLMESKKSDFAAPQINQNEIAEKIERKNEEEIPKKEPKEEEQTKPDPLPEQKPDAVVVAGAATVDQVEQPVQKTELLEEQTPTGGGEEQKRHELPTVSNSTIEESSPLEKQTHLPQLGGNVRYERKPLCDNSGFRVDLCDMDGDVRIPSNTSTIIFREEQWQFKEEQWRIHPYPRKGDNFCFGRVREITVESSTDAPECTKRHQVPAVFFSIGGYAGNLFHDFTDLLIPMFLTAQQYNGDVQFVISDYNPYWVYKYLLFFQKISNFPVIDYEKDGGVHCFEHVHVGLRCHKELSIVPARAPAGISMVDFNKFMRSAYSLPREETTNIEDLQGRKPRLMIIARKRTRAIVNLPELVKMAVAMGFEVVVDEADIGSEVAKFAALVNSVDVLLGVHGAGLTNMVFLPPNATVIQIVPWGRLEGIAMYDFGGPARDMGLNYLQYSIGIEESTLTEQYPKDHVVLTDPEKIHQQGFGTLRRTYMDKQNVKLDMNKFRTTLWKAIEHAIS